ncbi:MAG: hypothetical protein A2Y80_02085 [Deltaproteobacteria bacterium RBG_13_58_19]|nr:MAG: hypothetical protein A2Y80_02085 [Deltaproteobacteria bacterium RBG_13_58_19]
MHPLRGFLKKTKEPLGNFAIKVGTTSVYLCHVMAGRKIPGDDLVEAIIRESGGQLIYRDFKPEKADQIERIRSLETQHS